MKDITVGKLVRTGAWGVLVGGTAGFVLGLLLAPEEGQRLRRRLSYRLEHLGHQVSTLADNLLSPEAASEARRSGDALVADAQEQARQIQDEIDSLLGEVRRSMTTSSK